MILDHCHEVMFPVETTKSAFHSHFTVQTARDWTHIPVACPLRVQETTFLVSLMQPRVTGQTAHRGRWGQGSKHRPACSGP